MQKVNEIFGFLSPKQQMTLDNKTLKEKVTTLANLYRDDLDKDELFVEIESFKLSVIGSENLAENESKKSKLNSNALDFFNYLYTTGQLFKFDHNTKNLLDSTSFCRIK
ncbi:hypothetical protein AVEN_225151-1 [Araneus ventricosus]|uniref:Uncharacterized protein n=1 Tax=Araneus ventricosus TaxID=182803 RepID=A0A4Y2FVE6_ARAVE|nr:hypothetical protein AVEN_225151-1 [Araneus ventricosus]